MTQKLGNFQMWLITPGQCLRYFNFEQAYLSAMDLFTLEKNKLNLKGHPQRFPKLIRNLNMFSWLTS